MKAALIIAAMAIALPAQAQTCNPVQIAEMKAIAQTLESRDKPDVAQLLARWNDILGTCLRSLPPSDADASGNPRKSQAADIGKGMITGAAR